MARHPPHSILPTWVLGTVVRQTKKNPVGVSAATRQSTKTAVLCAIVEEQRGRVATDPVPDMDVASLQERRSCAGTASKRVALHVLHQSNQCTGKSAATVLPVDVVPTHYRTQSTVDHRPASMECLHGHVQKKQTPQ